MTSMTGIPGSDRARRRGSGRRLAWVLTTLIAASASLVAGCGTTAAGQPPGAARTAQAGKPAAPQPVQLASDELGTEILGAYFPATASQYAAGAKFLGRMTSLQTQIASACMARHGFGFPAVPATSEAARIWDLSQFPDIAWMRQHGLMVPVLNMAAFRPPAPPAGKEQAYRVSLARCTTVADRPFSRLRADTQPLADEWITVFTAIQASRRVQGRLAQFSSCVRQAGAPAGYSQNLNRFAVWAGAQVTQPSTGMVMRGPDQRWGEVFVRCAQNLAALYEKLQLTAQARFFRQHYRQIGQLQSEVSQMLVSAGQLASAQGGG
jgi:hypothetical protein